MREAWTHSGPNGDLNSQTELWAAADGNWRRLTDPARCPTPGDPDVEVNEIAYGCNGDIIIDDLSGRPPEVLHASSGAEPVRLAGHFVAYRSQVQTGPSTSDDVVEVYDRQAAKPAYRVALSELRKQLDVPVVNTASPALGFDINDAGTLVVNLINPTSFNGDGRAAWFSLAQPAAHVVSVPTSGAAVSIVGDQILLRRGTDRAFVVVDLAGNVVDHLKRSVQFLAFNGRDYAWVTSNGLSPVGARLAFPATAPKLQDADPELDGTPSLAFRVSQPTRISIRVDQCSNGSGGLRMRSWTPGGVVCSAGQAGSATTG